MGHGDDGAGDGGSMAHVQLHTGGRMPVIGLGMWPGYSQEEKRQTGATVKAAVAAGYRHFDSASVYGNEKDIGLALQEIFLSGAVTRGDLWITSKLWNPDHDRVQEACDQTLQDLQLDYLDLYLIHWPVRVKEHYQQEDGTRKTEIVPLQLDETWKKMEQLVRTGRVRAIGVSNFSSKKIDHLLANATIVPAVNQVECHPVWQQKALHDYCTSKAIHLSGYSPLGNWGPKVLGHPIVREIADKLSKSPAQVALRWGIQMGHSVLPKSSNPDRLKENLDIFGWSIPDEDFQKLSGIQQERLIKGTMWVNDTSPYKRVEDLWDE
ncbi:hypothetical protein SELMODRAFT_441624 [Selaginella moellendorffii]|uniref:NADP-dependent oxidoreductase domain-containing protein n=1 Tax=Selaginella moellendorffii TaxID=88036 RepID=D8RLG7_SELML|nr:aldo-keto reductase family 4 member C10 isoform X1 [Selaginella moellendorffii]EFJ26912.1 hypothetical protein SELMODRAFT_441624 [Selaginella moellendorffii]|eukprot:XP_002971995.1 aldo-keto reductase family 4 member C10 isoform X1 [Selaginella moellendorffii]